MAKDEKPLESSHVFGKELGAKLLVPVALAVLAYAALLFYGDAPSVVRSLHGLRFSALAAALTVSLGSFALRGLRWQVYLRVLEIRIPLADSALVFLAGLGMSITPGKVGELLKSLLLKERHEVPVASSAPVIIAERVMDLSALVLLGGASLGWTRAPRVVIVVVPLLVGALYVVGRSRRIGTLAVRLLGKLPAARKYGDKFAEARASLERLWAPAPFSVAIALSVLAWGLQALTVCIFASAFDGRELSLRNALIVYAAPLLAGTLALLPGGLGLTEASMAGSLRILSGMSSRTAVATTILTRAVTFWFAVVLGFTALATWRIRGRGAQSALDRASREP